MVKAPGQAAARIVGYDVSNSEIRKSGNQKLQMVLRGASPFFIGINFNQYRMDFQISAHQLKLIIQQAAELGAIQALIKAGKLKPYLKKSEAFRKYGRANIEHWAENGLITVRKDGDHSAPWRIDRLEVEAIVKSIVILRFL